MALKKTRLDILLVQKGIFPSREQARRAIMAGEVLVGDTLVDKPGTAVTADVSIRLKKKSSRYVSRGGEKLAAAIEAFELDFRDAVVFDAGASTGGFTDAALTYGARLVYAVDVGYGQLDWSLRQDPRVIVMERQNIRYFEPAMLPGPPPDIVVVDVSFISLRLVLPPLKRLLKPGGAFVLLVKPQFEAGPDAVGKGGIVRDARVHETVLLNMLDLLRFLDLSALGLIPSPIRGGDGNIEFLMYARALMTDTVDDKTSKSSSSLVDEHVVRRVVQEAHSQET